MGATACMCPEEGPLQNLMHRAKQAFEPPECIMRDILFNSPLAEMSGALPGTDHKNGNKQVVVELDSREKKCTNLWVQIEFTNI